MDDSVRVAAVYRVPGEFLSRSEAAKGLGDEYRRQYTICKVTLSELLGVRVVVALLNACGWTTAVVCLGVVTLTVQFSIPFPPSIHLWRGGDGPSVRFANVYVH